ncbi:MAG TPA: MaoC family dehydratase [Burkholderiales bacterium]|jgi:acyl dehydratase|nr:MaoC family dehydratase [Burkholderiales bacterium]
MPIAEFTDIDQLRNRIGQEVAVSDWITIAQDRIDRFADATDDHQWIHVDRSRAANSPLKGTIAHGFLTLSMLPYFMNTALKLPPARMTLNYGLNRVRFTNPVPAGKRIRARIKLLDIEEGNTGTMDLYWKVTIDVEGADKPACIAETIARRYAVNN